MSGQMLRVLAVLFALGAVLVGWYGYHLSQQAPPVAQAPAQGGEPVVASPPVEVVQRSAVFLRQPLQPGQSVAAGQVAQRQVPLLPAGAFEDPAEVIGRVALASVGAGEILLRSHFEAGSPLSRALEPGERAVAIQVNEVIGGGGFIGPGDVVDVLGYFRPARGESEQTLAQTVLRRVRVIAYGDALTQAAQPEAELALGEKENEDAAVIRQQRREALEPSKGRSAVLAVPVDQVARLLLAESAGQLRLAAYGARELGVSSLPVDGEAPAKAAADRVTLEDLTQPEPRPETGPKVVRRDPGVRVTIFRGGDSSTVYTR